MILGRSHSENLRFPHELRCYVGVLFLFLSPLFHVLGATGNRIIERFVVDIPIQLPLPDFNSA
jgi:hypothetical protein